MIILIPIITSFSYENQNQTEPRKLNIFNRIILSLRSITRSASEDEYKNYNSQKSYKSGKKRVLT
jgi:hypothetical protein